MSPSGTILVPPLDLAFFDMFSGLLSKLKLMQTVWANPILGLGDDMFPAEEVANGVPKFTSNHKV